MEIWGGIECTINRVGGEFKDQLNYSGHYQRSGDLKAIADLGISTIRYPLLWEKHQPEKNIQIDWRWADEQLHTIRDLGMIPIAGLLHHGSGPAYTNLLDPEFPYLFAAYAYEVASRYPWVNDYTPVNEPLTTARFSGLYGLWYPHDNNESSFYKMLLNQLKATVLAMEAIRSINPLARLIQTEDLGKTHSTALLNYQSVFENDRRLLTFDILTGLLKPGHPQYFHILNSGISEDEINFFQIHSVRPDVLGLNYYITSERWLDDGLEKYPHSTHGSNGTHSYADTEVVRADPDSRAGFPKLATEIWDRYAIPMAVTECHLHCTREEQLRWFKEIWDQAIHLSQKGIIVKAVTAWALLGSFNWDSLLTRTGTQYESGVFDIMTFPGMLRPTALAGLIKNLNTATDKLHPVISAPGWWHGDGLPMTGDRHPVVIIEGRSEERMSGKLLAALKKACLLRRIHFFIAENSDEINMGQLEPWATIEWFPGQELFSICYCNKKSEEGLMLIADELSMNIHQINKMLDLMIDGDQGCWLLSADNTLFKSGQPVQLRQLAQ